MKKLVLTALLAVWMAGCALVENVANHQPTTVEIGDDMIFVGMPTEKLIQKFGKPDGVEACEGGELWKYTRTAEKVSLVIENNTVSKIYRYDK